MSHGDELRNGSKMGHQKTTHTAISLPVEVPLKVTESQPVQVMIDVVCDICGVSTKSQAGPCHYGTLGAEFGFGSMHDGESYEVDLCENCFFDALTFTRHASSTKLMASRTGDAQAPKNFGLVDTQITDHEQAKKRRRIAGEGLIALGGSSPTMEDVPRRKPPST